MSSSVIVGVDFLTPFPARLLRTFTPWKMIFALLNWGSSTMFMSLFFKPSVHVASKALHCLDMI